MHDRAAAVGRVASIVFLGIVPIVAVVVMFQVGWSSDSLAIDFHNEIYPEAKLLLHGTNPFPGPDADLSRGSNYIWPPFVGYVVAPLTLLPAGGADIAAATLSLIAFVAALWIVGVRDWRVYGASVLWPPVVGETRTAHLTLVLCLLLAVAWRTRDRFPAAGITVGVALALKFFLWPLVIWLAALRRWRDAAIAAGLALATLLLVLPFISLPEYARLLRRLGTTFDQDSFSPFGLLAQLGASDRVAHVVAAVIGVVVIAIAWRLQSFVLFVAAALLLSPIVWLDYYAVLAVPLAIVRPRLSVLWLLPLLTWGITSAGIGVGHVETSLRTLAIFSVITVFVVRAERSRGDEPASAEAKLPRAQLA
jgi:hypothetical protein